MDLPITISNSELWKKSLGNDSEWGFEEKRQQLISYFESFRKNAKNLAEHIARDLPDYTVHDIDHLDALWEMASQIAGENIKLNPMEAFVFGGAILLHDLGMASVAYINGVEDLRNGEEWEDSLEFAFRQRYGRVSNEQDDKHNDVEIMKVATENRLRLLHAKHAEKMCFIEWGNSEGVTHRLLNETELLEQLGETIGLIAASHWWSIDKVESDLNKKFGSPTSFPAEWSVDCLNLACLLRCADAAHIDNRRAPSFLKILRKPNGISDIHWTFQNKLSRPTVTHDLLIYESTRAFNESDMEAWWTAYDSIKMIDNEIKDANNTLRNNGRDPFKVYGVKGANNVTLLSHHIRTENWEPVNIGIKISNVSNIVKNLGGAELYGDFKFVAIREAIQNAVDAIEAKRRLYDLNDKFGKIIISYGEDEKGRWLEVTDNGIGMTKRVVTDKLLDFGTSYWSSSLMLNEHSGLLSKGFKSIGKFGLGFFTLFMLGDVNVITKSVYVGPDETISLHISKELNLKPILKKVSRSQQLPDSGTKVKIYLDESVSIEEIVSSIETKNLRHDPNKKKYYNSLEFLLKKLAPTLTVDMYLDINGVKKKIIEGNDWKEIDTKTLICRLIGIEFEELPIESQIFIEKYKQLVKPIFNTKGEMIGRLGIMPNDDHSKVILSGVSTIGGLVAENTNLNIVGVLIGDTLSANRYDSIPLAGPEKIKEWAIDQCRDLESVDLTESMQYRAAAVINLCGSTTGNLDICKSKHGSFSYNYICKEAIPEEIVITDMTKNNLISELNENVVISFPLDTTFFDTFNIKNLHSMIHSDLNSKKIPFETLLKAISINWGIEYENLVLIEEIQDYLKQKYNKYALGINKYGEEVYGNAIVLNKNEILCKARVQKRTQEIEAII